MDFRSARLRLLVLRLDPLYLRDSQSNKLVSGVQLDQARSQNTSETFRAPAVPVSSSTTAQAHYPALIRQVVLDPERISTMSGLIRVKYFSRSRSIIIPFFEGGNRSRCGGNVGNAHAFSKGCGKRCLLSISPLFPRLSRVFTPLLWLSWPVRLGNSGC